MFVWLMLSLLILGGFGGFMGWSFEHVENHCLQANQALMLEGKEGPLQVCR